MLSKRSNPPLLIVPVEAEGLGQADHVRNGNAKAVMSLSKVESTKLWDSLRERASKASCIGGFGVLTELDDFDKFWSVNEKLVNVENPKNIPLRIYVPSAPRIIQQPIPPVLPTRSYSHLLY
jgi:autophagy-related protein 5